MADIMNVPPRDNDYDWLNDNSTDLERLDVVFKILLKSYAPIWLTYKKLGIKHGKERAFDVKLKETRLVDYNDSNGYNPTYKINDMGIKVFETYNKYSDFFYAVQEHEKKKQEKVEIKENLEMQKLHSEVQDLTNRIFDYSKTKSQSKWALIIAVIAALATIAQVLLQLKGK